MMTEYVWASSVNFSPAFSSRNRTIFDPLIVIIGLVSKPLRVEVPLDALEDLDHLRRNADRSSMFIDTPDRHHAWFRDAKILIAYPWHVT